MPRSRPRQYRQRYAAPAPPSVKIIRKCYRGEMDVNDGMKFVQMLAANRDTLLIAKLEERMLDFKSRLATDPTTRGVYVLPPLPKKVEKAVDLTKLVKGPSTPGEE